jgi:hypothetical protein
MQVIKGSIPYPTSFDAAEVTPYPVPQLQELSFNCNREQKLERPRKNTKPNEASEYCYGSSNTLPTKWETLLGYYHKI